MLLKGPCCHGTYLDFSFGALSCGRSPLCGSADIISFYTVDFMVGFAVSFTQRGCCLGKWLWFCLFAGYLWRSWAGWKVGTLKKINVQKRFIVCRFRFPLKNMNLLTYVCYFQLFIYLFIYSFNLVKTMDQTLQNICKEKIYVIPPNLYKIIINRYIEVLQIKMVIINNVN